MSVPSCTWNSAPRPPQSVGVASAHVLVNALGRPRALRNEGEEPLPNNAVLSHGRNLPIADGLKRLEPTRGFEPRTC